MPASDLLLGAGAGLAFLLLVNVPAARLGFTFEDDGPRGLLEPPGWLVVAAWLLLLPSLGVARALVLRTPGGDAVGWWIVGLAVLCATYAYSTVGLSRRVGVPTPILGLAVNGLVVVAALAIAIPASARSAASAGVLLAVAAWTAFASISVASSLRRGSASRR